MTDNFDNGYFIYKTFVEGNLLRIVSWRRSFSLYIYLSKKVVLQIQRMTYSTAGPRGTVSCMIEAEAGTTRLAVCHSGKKKWWRFEYCHGASGRTEKGYVAVAPLM